VALRWNAGLIATGTLSMRRATRPRTGSVAARTWRPISTSAAAGAAGARWLTAVVSAPRTPGATVTTTGGWFGSLVWHGTSPPTTIAGTMPRTLSIDGSPVRHCSVTFSVVSGGADRTAPGASGQAIPSRLQPDSDGPSGSSLKVQSTSAGWAGVAHTVPQRSATLSTRWSVFSIALGAGVGNQVSRASWATGLGSVVGAEVHHTTGAALPFTAGVWTEPLPSTRSRRMDSSS